MKKFAIILPLFLFVFQTISAQKNILVEIGKHKFTVQEFERIYQKNNSQLAEKNDIKSPAEYLEMFIDFKLKVIEAENRGMDTLASFVEEFKGYRDELAKPYLTDVTFTEAMVQTAYFRSVNEVDASHILILVDENAPASDTLIAYEKILDIRKQFVSGQKSFEELAVAYSEDPSAQNNKGSLGYFRAFQMVTPFENTAFETKPGEVSMPIRTRFGYHLVYTKDLRPAKPDIRVAHIMKMFGNQQDGNGTDETRLKTQIDSIYQLLLKGEDFGQLARDFSDDKRSATNNGEMSWINPSFGVPEFTDVAYALKNDGDFSEVIRTDFGWHIVKRLETRQLPTFKELEEQLTMQVRNDPHRSMYNKLNFLNKLKAQYKYSKNTNNINQLMQLLVENGIDSVSSTVPGEFAQIELFSFAGNKYTVANFVDYLFQKHPESDLIATSNILKELDAYEENTVIGYEDALLETKYPEFGALMQEYHDGILLFSIMEEEVWNKAMIDSVGLELFFRNNPNKFEMGEHFDGLLIECASTETREEIEKILESGETNPDVIKGLMSKADEQTKIVKGRWEKGENPIVNYFVWKGEKPESLNEELVFTHGFTKTEGYKSLEEARGLYVSEYQDFLEKEWINDLRAKYPVRINNKLLKKVKPVSK